MKLTISRHNSTKLANGLLPGDISLLSIISSDTFTNMSTFPKYLTKAYNINTSKRLQGLIKQGYVEVKDVYASLEDHATVAWLRQALKDKSIKGLSTMRRLELLDLIEVIFSQKELEKIFKTRGYFLTEKGEKALYDNQSIIVKHSKKPTN